MEGLSRFLELKGGKTRINGLDKRMSVLLSPAHGDLNSSNLLLWLDDLSHPFLIDFPSYQTNGHALQDFARLEVEVKFMIMDRQNIPGAAPALDYTHSQLPLWKEFEDHVLAAELPDPGPVWQNNGHRESVDICLQLLQKLRACAIEIQKVKRSESDPDFFTEYLPPLFYHTLHAISYPSLDFQAASGGLQRWENSGETKRKGLNCVRARRSDIRQIQRSVGPRSGNRVVRQNTGGPSCD